MKYTLQDFQRMQNIADAHKPLVEAIAKAVTTTADVAGQKRDLANAGQSIWQNWREIALIGAAEGLNATDVGNLIDLRIGSVDDEKKQKALGPYRSRIATLVPIFALSDDEYAELFSEAHIKRDGEPMEPTKEINSRDAVQLIRAAKGKDNTEQAAFEAARKRLVDYINSQAKPGKFDEDMKPEAKAEARKDAFRAAALLCTELYENATQDEAEALAMLHDADEGVEATAAAVNG